MLLTYRVIVGCRHEWSEPVLDTVLDITCDGSPRVAKKFYRQTCRKCHKLKITKNRIR